MISAPPAPQEQARLSALRALSLLDTGAEERFDRVTRMAGRMLGVPIALVSLVDEDRQWFKSSQGITASQTPRDISFCGHVVAVDRLLVVPDAAVDERFADNPLVLGDPHIRFYAGVPVHSQGHAVGTLCVMDSQPRTVTVTDLSVLQDLADLLEDELGRTTDAMVDPLTGLLGRRGLDEVCRHLLGHAVREGRDIAVVFGDVDGLKSINDSHGHAAGDRALMEVAEVLARAFRDADAVARLSGDEFCAVLVAGPGGFTPATAAQLVERAQSLLRERNASTSAPYELQVSLGVASAPASPDVLAELLRRADEEMYVNKHRPRGA